MESVIVRLLVGLVCVGGGGGVRTNLREFNGPSPLSVYAVMNAFLGLQGCSAGILGVFS